MAVALESTLLEILACPAPDHGALRVEAAGAGREEHLRCTECGRGYPVRDGIPVLLLDEAVDGPEEPGATGER
ncbi:Trm112 family protein [Saccharopolyspora sp. MS10]|uniref:Trm112 family protein n=1 Tax=Saccharopolyspora sp. MS10 TaxID=3385973 RepID=UPI0039A251C6